MDCDAVSFLNGGSVALALDQVGRFVPICTKQTSKIIIRIGAPYNREREGALEGAQRSWYPKWDRLLRTLIERTSWHNLTKCLPFLGNGSNNEQCEYEKCLLHIDTLYLCQESRDLNGKKRRLQSQFFCNARTF